MVRISSISFIVLGILSTLKTRAETMKLESGIGCEHILVLPGPDGRQIALTSRAEHRGGFRVGLHEGLGFAFIEMKNDRPVVTAVQNPLEFPTLQDIGPHSWQALDWNSQGPQARHGVVVAAAPTKGRFDGRSTHAIPRVEFFNWDASSKSPRLKACPQAASDPLPHSKGQNFNAISLASNGDVYASVIGFRLPNKRAVEIMHRDMELCGKVEDNAVYLWKASESKWYQVAGNVQGANGLFLCPDGSRLCVNAFQSHAVIVFDRDAHSGWLTKCHTIDLGPGHYPDNLSRLSGTKASAMCTPGIWSGLALFSSGIFGSKLGLNPSATIWEVDADQSTSPTLLQKVPPFQGVFSDATRFGSWWLCGPMVGNGIYCIRSQN